MSQFFDKIRSKIVKDNFEDGLMPNSNVGTNSMRTSSVKGKLLKNIPQLRQDLLS
jgi:hypothetical protein